MKATHPVFNSTPRALCRWPTDSTWKKTVLGCCHLTMSGNFESFSGANIPKMHSLGAERVINEGWTVASA